MPDEDPHPVPDLRRQHARRNDRQEFDKLFGVLGTGGAVTMPPQDTFWGARFGMLTDKFGVSWMLNLELPKKE